MKALHMIAFVLVIIGGLNWLLFGIWGIDVVSYLPTTWLDNVVYVLVGLSAILLMFTHKSSCKACASSQEPMSQM